MTFQLPTNKHIKPVIIKNSIVPVLLTYIAPIHVSACSIGPFIFLRDQGNEQIIRHETIHFQQQVELLFVFQWILYAIFHIRGMMKNKGSLESYRNNPFELEAYGNENDTTYLTSRRSYAWIKFLKNA